MNKKLFCSAVIVVVVGIILVSAYLASAAPPEGKGYDRVLEKRTFIHYRKAYGKPPWAGGGNGKDKTEEQGYYTYLANGAKWKLTEDCRLNPENLDGVDVKVVADAVDAGMDEWEKAKGVSFNIFGNVILDNTATYDGGAYTGDNTISFGAYADPQVIAVTTVWGYFSGPPSQRELVEAHMLLNDGDYFWGDDDANPGVMDLQNILTHELGHWAGMGDLYESAAAKETMYGYSATGETDKRTLYIGDIEGIGKLY